ncbi:MULTISPECIES: hypothetical protein [Lysinibacillus]|jgi:hypothetical protein|uniref:hypothetical protein n=1 Tax=Lysinibacillus TaxID=400634 RepID=UPI000AA57308|nr:MULTISPECIES: hypothetical protein [Lysinibacillus]
MTKMTAEQMVSLIKVMKNGEHNKFLEYLFHAQFDSRITDDYELVTNEIEDV